MSQNFLPISIDISKPKILVLGGGQDAWKKIKILQRFDAQVEVIAKQVCDEIKESGINFIEAPYDKKYLNGYLMLYSCLNDDELDRQIVKDGKEAGVLVNIHDKPALCQFVSPAIYRHGK